MKISILNYLFTGIVFAGLTSCFNGQASTDINEENSSIVAEKTDTASAQPLLTFEEKEYDFGTITEGEIVEHNFNFTNTGNAPLVIINAKGSCGCTVSKWPKEPIAPGASGSFLVSFNSKGKPNLQNKQVTITANTEKGKEILKIRAQVTPKGKK